MGDSENHQCRVCDEIFHSYEDLETHCAVHVDNGNPHTRPSFEIVSTFTIGNSSDAGAGNSENCAKIQDSRNVAQVSQSSDVKVEQSSNDDNTGTGTHMIWPSTIKIKLEKSDEALVPSNAEASSSNLNGLTGLVKQPLIISTSSEPSDIILKFPNIFSAISKPPASIPVPINPQEVKRKLGNGDMVDRVQKMIKRSRLPDTGFACHLCGETFNKKDKLRQHMHSHMKEKFFKCDICGEKFLDRTQLDHHRPKHFFRCETCGEGFIKYTDLKAHSVKHDSVSKFTCFVCGKSFPYKSILLAHIDIHNTGAFECDHCFAKFNGRAQLSKHYFAHHSSQKKGNQAKLKSSGTDNDDSASNSIDNTTDSDSVQDISVEIKSEPN